MSDPPRWHGLTDEQWAALFDGHGWRSLVERTLREVASSPDASIEDRLVALHTLNQAIMQKYLPDSGTYPLLAREVLFEITRGASTRWRPGRARRRKALAMRLCGARNMLQTVAQFVHPQSSATTEQPSPTTRVLDYTKMPS